MFRNRIYYGIKPLLPLGFRLRIRRWLAMRKRQSVADIWPIKPGSGEKPEGWPGWPGGKKFAVVLTHDVEGVAGLEKCRSIYELETSLGFRSSFNLIPEGGYRAGAELRADLAANGFEVGVHDLHHDGKLYRSRAEFSRKALRINDYLKEWGAVGFRSGFMLHNLNWLHDLNIQYDASTFDTDPFEPQPHGKHTIFPFWVPRPSTDVPAPDATDRHGYVELPYTLPQDSTLFLLLAERHPDIWFQKVDWIASKGGMVLLDTHPDYMSLNGACNAWEYPVSNYERLLEYIQKRYADQYWLALPREVAAYARDHYFNTKVKRGGRRKSASVPKKIWLDLDNTPHVPFFEPILHELEERGYPVLVTARDAFQVCELADKKHMRYVRIGRHYGKSRVLKASGLAYRALQLAPSVLKEKPALAVSHGARSQLLLGTMLRLPTLLLEDYEHARFPLMMRPRWVMAPEVIPASSICCKEKNIRRYPGIKEDVYAWKLAPDPGVLKVLGIDPAEIVVTVRPPATEAHYHNPESEVLFTAFMARAMATPGIRVILLPRNKKQGDLIRAQSPVWFKNDKTVIPEEAVDGLNLIWHSDLVVSGGGTMNREAAALGVPVYSIFRGTIGAVDQNLSREGRLTLIHSVEDSDSRILLRKRPQKNLGEVTSRKTLHCIVDAIEEIAAASERNSSRNGH